MYRYHFDVSRAAWLLQFLKFGLIWMTVKDARSEDKGFDTVEAVDAYVVEHGIDKVYRRLAHPIEREPLFYVPGTTTR